MLKTFHLPSAVLLLICLCHLTSFANSAVHTTEELVAAAQDATAGSTIEIGAGTYRLAAPLTLGPGVTLKGAGVGETILTHTANWKPSTEKLPLGEMRPNEADSDAYLIRLQDKAADITVSHLTLRGPQMHGAIFGVSNQNLHLHHLCIDTVLYSGIRCYFAKRARIHDCEFIDAGGKWKRGGIPGTDGGISGGAIFVTWMSDSEISHNRIRRTRNGRQYGHYGVKGRGGKDIHIHHNTIEVNFSIEFPFEGDEAMEIDHNILRGVVSIPKHAGGKVLPQGRSFHIHHNYFTTSYAIEFPRNNVEIDHNLFDFEVDQDGGNLISGFGGVASPGPAWFHNNLISNPGRGVIWIERAYKELVIRNNHIVARRTVTPRKEGLFAIGGKDFSKLRFFDNIVACEGQPRPLFRNEASHAADIRNNRLTNIADSNRYKNQLTDAEAGLEQPLLFHCGVHGELTVDGWTTQNTNDQ